VHTAGPRTLIVLTRFPVSLAVTFSAFTAMVMSADSIQAALLLPLAGIFLLASGASALNQYQEWPYDEKMARTKRRPLPSRKISPAEATRIAMICIAGGLLLLYYYATAECLLLGVANLFWYNIVYTFLKRKTAFAVVPGALTGAIPVYMGWLAGGGKFDAPQPLLLAFFLFIWQMPHFWMLTLKYGEEYRAAGFPTLSDHFSGRQIRTIVMVWMAAASAASVMLIYFRILHLPLLGFVLIGLNAVLLVIMAWQLLLASTPRFRLVFLTGNFFMMAVMLSLIANRLLSHGVYP